MGIYYNYVPTSGCELGRHLYSPHFIDEEPEAHRGPWSCLKPWTLLSTHGSRLSRHEQSVHCGRLAVCPTSDYAEDTCRAWAGGPQFCPALWPPSVLPRSLLSGLNISLLGSPPSWVVGSWNQIGGSPTGLLRAESPLVALGAALVGQPSPALALDWATASHSSHPNPASGAAWGQRKCSQEQLSRTLS